MNTRFVSIVIAFVIVGGLLVFQATRQGASPVLMPSELRPEVEISRVRVIGRVADSPIDYVTEPKARLAFRVSDPKNPDGVSVPVVYNGIRPDMFAVGRDVIIDGEFTGGTVAAATLQTQCPSKYEAPDPAASAPGYKKEQAVAAQEDSR